MLGPGSQSRCGTGISLNFSKTGIEFTTEDLLPPGSVIEFSVDWPVDLNTQCALKFVGRGCVVRSHDDRAAVEIHGYEFRTRRKHNEDGRASSAKLTSKPSAPALPSTVP